METVNIHDAKTNLSKLLERVQQGEEIIVGKAGKPIAKLVPYVKPAKPKEPRKLGLAKGQIFMTPDFNDPDPELEDLFYNGALFPDEMPGESEPTK